MLLEGRALRAPRLREGILSAAAQDKSTEKYSASLPSSIHPLTAMFPPARASTDKDPEAQLDETAPQPQDELTSYQEFLNAIRGPMAEFFGTALLVIFGAGAGAAVLTSSSPSVSPSGPRGDFLSVNFGWAVGLAIGIWVSDGISNGHINPAITVAMATWRKFPWRKVPSFILAQLLGGLVGSALIYGLYVRVIDLYEGGARSNRSAAIFVTFPTPSTSPASAFFTELLGTLILAFVILILTDERNGVKPAPGLYPLAMLVLFLGVGTSLGLTGWALNPARDFGPRVFLAMAGYGRGVWTERSHYWIWGPILAPFLGAQVGAFLYNYFLYTGLKKSRSPGPAAV